MTTVPYIAKFSFLFAVLKTVVGYNVPELFLLDISLVISQGRPISQLRASVP